MSYSIIETGLKAIIKKVTGYTDANVALGDFRVLNAGYTKVIILTQGSFTNRRLAMGGEKERLWAIQINLFIKYKDDAQVHTDLVTEKQLILEKVDEYPELDNVNGVIEALVISGDVPRRVFDDSGAGPHYFALTLTCQIKELVYMTEKE